MLNLEFAITFLLTIAMFTLPLTLSLWICNGRLERRLEMKSRFEGIGNVGTVSTVNRTTADSWNVNSRCSSPLRDWEGIVSYSPD